MSVMFNVNIGVKVNASQCPWSAAAAAVRMCID